MKSLLFILIAALLISSCSGNNDLRKVQDLNGIWDIAVTGLNGTVPTDFTSKVQVPGLVDMAIPALQNQDTVYENSIFWYRRQFKVDNPSSEVILLKINKSCYHTTVFVNGIKAGENVYSFTPSWIDIKPYIKTDGSTNELIISTGCKNNLPDTVTNGWDFEKIKYIPGIYDEVSVTEADLPYINNVQTVPDIKNKAVRVVAEIKSPQHHKIKLKYSITERATGRQVAAGTAKAGRDTVSGVHFADFKVPLDSCRLWSPADPFLYDLRISTRGDEKVTRFGMRTFEASPDSAIFLLNGKPLYITGTNVCIYRFFEDPQRGALPWDSKWVTMLHSRFREMNWTMIRYCIGFPPERWYEIADSLGFMIQDEYPLWTLSKQNYSKHLGRLNSKQLAAEYHEWMRERWNHPCVVVWDAQNESITDTTGKAIMLVRHLDLSGRPWDNGWAPPVSEADAIESHPYLFSRYMNQKPGKTGYLKELLGEVRIPGNDPNSHYPLPGGKRYTNPIILNEYGWIWLNRDGSTTTLTDKVYENVFPGIMTAEKRLETYAKNLGILTEYWRSFRKAAAVMHFCGLGYSRPERPRGQTSDHFTDIKNLTFEPNFFTYVRQAFSPVGVMVEFWENSVRAGEKILIPVRLVNDTWTEFNGTLKLKVTMGGIVRQLEKHPVILPGLGTARIEFPFVVPRDKGQCIVEAEIIYKDMPVRSTREFTVK